MDSLCNVMSVLNTNGIKYNVSAGDIYCKETGFKKTECYFVKVVGRCTIAMIERLVCRIKGVIGVHFVKNGFGEYVVRIAITR